jgi:hypothetical protein
MRLVFITACLLLASLVYALPVSASERRMQRQYSINVIVECLETALEVVRDLPGINLNANITNIEPHTGRPLRQAHFTRRVESWAFVHMQAVLRDLGEVTMESENAQHLGAEWASTETRLKILSQEIERLSIMMAASTSLHVLIAIDNHLSHVSWERDRLMGRRNQILAESDSVVMYINLSEETEYIRPAVPGFGRRTADSFLRSWNALLRTGGNLAVFIVRISVPLAIWLAAGAVIIFFCLRAAKAKSKNLIKPEVVEADGPGEGAIIDGEK